MSDLDAILVERLRQAHGMDQDHVTEQVQNGPVDMVDSMLNYPYIPQQNNSTSSAQCPASLASEHACRDPLAHPFCGSPCYLADFGLEDVRWQGLTRRANPVQAEAHTQRSFADTYLGQAVGAGPRMELASQRQAFPPMASLQAASSRCLSPSAQLYGQWPHASMMPQCAPAPSVQKYPSPFSSTDSVAGPPLTPANSLYAVSSFDPVVTPAINPVNAEFCAVCNAVFDILCNHEFSCFRHKSESFILYHTGPVWPCCGRPGLEATGCQSDFHYSADDLKAKEKADKERMDAYLKAKGEPERPSTQEHSQDQVQKPAQEEPTQAMHISPAESQENLSGQSTSQNSSQGPQNSSETSQGIGDASPSISEDLSRILDGYQGDFDGVTDLFEFLPDANDANDVADVDFDAWLNFDKVLDADQTAQ